MFGEIYMHGANIVHKSGNQTKFRTPMLAE